MKKIAIVFLFVLLASASAFAQSENERMTATRDKMRAVLTKFASSNDAAFKQSDKQPFNFIGVITKGLKYSDSLEIVISITPKDTIHFRIYPHYKGDYINVNKAKNSDGLMRYLLELNDRAFLFWGKDDENDVFAGYTFTLESGFPEEAIKVVLSSIRNTDQFVGEMKGFIN